MDLQISFLMLEEDAMSSPEKQICDICLHQTCMIAHFPHFKYFLEGLHFANLIDEVTSRALDEAMASRYGGLRSLFRRDEPEKPGSKIEMQFSFDREDMFKISCNRNAGDHHWKLSCLWKETLHSQKELCGKEPLSQEPQKSLDWNSLICTGTGYQRIGPLRALVECPQNHFTAPSGRRIIITTMNKMKEMNDTGNRFYPDNNEPCVVLDIDLMEAFDWGGKMTSELHWFDRNVPRDPMFQHGDTFKQHKRMKIAQHVSSFVVSNFAFLGIFFNLWSQISNIQVQTLYREHPASIWPPLLGLLGFMVFVWAVAIMILVGAPFTRMQRAMLVFWAISMLLKSANSISAVFVPILGILFMGWFALGKAAIE